MPVSSADVNGAATAAAAITALGGESNDCDRDGSSSRRLQRPIAWLNMMRACDGGASDVLLEKFRGANSTATTTTTTIAVTAAAAEDGDATPTEVTTSNKCEGQLSCTSLKTNSCSSCCCCCKPTTVASRTTEMAQEDHSGGPSWDNLPSVILQEIFSYLSHESRITASQVDTQTNGERVRERERDRYLFRILGKIFLKRI